MRLFLTSALLACSACGATTDQGSGGAEAPRPPVGLSTTLPIYWPESAEFGAVLQEGGEPGWVRQEIETRFDLAPLDFLSAEALAPLDRLLLAQPRALSAAENVALDDWVRAGGQLLLFADPMLTSHSQFSIGDPRRPQDVALLSPILARWGLELTFDTGQPQGERLEDAFGVAVPVDLAGAFVPLVSEAAGECAIAQSGVAARCRIGEGQVTLLADAALLDGEEDPDLPRRRAVLGKLVEQSFAL
ncbi:hypothetical protein A9995_08055 [Erythrobacter sp. QSSC1-22B]|uniref:Gldg family protein n=1 Tax=Erythrobacter sp. QSSC1-22B TaxID=1860125 RepID=UPI0008051F24|nr:Gldg family protein [Erythrobacter sp. QSSC1-22B]OBX19088.1 hypothetical protein A9995_08055 [Erythrobacter sp. QSSC1-22B]